VSKNWERKHYSPGGGDALLYYAVFGQFEHPIGYSHSEYRSDGVPSELNVHSFDRDKSPDQFTLFEQNVFGDQLKQDKEMFAQVSSAPQLLLVTGTFTDPADLNYLRDTVGLLTALFDQGAVALCDLQTCTWWNRSEWRERYFDPDGSVPRHHAIILIEETGDTLWLHTRGMRKFGRPDVSVPRVPRENSGPYVDLCNRFIEHLAFGLLVPEGQPIGMSELPDGLTVHHAGSLDDPEFNNVHLEIA
jgi:hypothetical protein